MTLGLRLETWARGVETPEPERLIVRVVDRRRYRILMPCEEEAEAIESGVHLFHQSMIYNNPWPFVPLQNSARKRRFWIDILPGFWQAIAMKSVSIIGSGVTPAHTGR